MDDLEVFPSFWFNTHIAIIPIHHPICMGTASNLGKLFLRLLTLLSSNSWPVLQPSTPLGEALVNVGEKICPPQKRCREWIVMKSTLHVHISAKHIMMYLIYEYMYIYITYVYIYITYMYIYTPILYICKFIVVFHSLTSILCIHLWIMIFQRISADLQISKDTTTDLWKTRGLRTVG